MEPPTVPKRSSHCLGEGELEVLRAYLTPLIGWHMALGVDGHPANLEYAKPTGLKSYSAGFHIGALAGCTVFPFGLAGSSLGDEGWSRLGLTAQLGVRRYRTGFRYPGNYEDALAQDMLLRVTQYTVQGGLAIRL